MLTVDANDRTMVWTTPGGRRVAGFGADGLTDVDISSDGRRVVIAERSGRARVWDVPAERVIARLRNGDALRTALFDRRGQNVVTGDVSGVVRVWNAETGRALSVLRGHTAAIARARFSPDGTHVATASTDGSGRLWSAPLTPSDTRWQHAASTTFAPDSRRALVAEGSERAVWDTETGSVVSLDGGISNQGEPPSWWPCGHAAGCAPWSRDGELVAGATRANRAVVWDARSGRVQRPLGPAGSAIGAAFSRDGRRVVVVDANEREAQIWTLDGRREASAPTADDVRSAQFVGDSAGVLTVDFSGNARLSAPPRSLPGDVEPAAVAASRDGRRLAVGTTDGELHVFSGGEPTARVRRAGTKGITSVSFDAAGTRIATVGQDDTARIWNARTLAETTLRSPGGAVTGARFSPDGRFVLVSSGSTTRLWDLEMQRVVVELPRTPHARPGFSPDGRSIALAGDTRLSVERCYACLPLRDLVRHAQTLLAP